MFVPVGPVGGQLVRLPAQRRAGDTFHVQTDWLNITETPGQRHGVSVACRLPHHPFFGSHETGRAFIRNRRETPRSHDRTPKGLFVRRDWSPHADRSAAPMGP